MKKRLEKIKVLHISESFAGGVTSAIKEYVSCTNYIDHYLCASVRENDKTGEENCIPNIEEAFFVERKISSILKVKKIIKKINPDFIHLHSTYAGFLGRIFLWFSSYNIIYTPHGYCFLRNGGFLKNKIFFYIEKILSYRTQTIAACSEDEKIKSSKLLCKKVEVIPNIAGDVSISIKSIIDPYPGYKKIVMLGRISEQKDFNYFIELSKKNKDYKYIWIGGGGLDNEKKLIKNNILVTGWVDRSTALGWLSLADCYAHTAAWDGFPISVLEAAALNKPIVLRDIGPFLNEKLYVGENINHMMNMINDAINDPDNSDAMKNTVMINNVHTRANMERALNRIYSKP